MSKDWIQSFSGKEVTPAALSALAIPAFVPEHVVVADFETYFDDDYSLKKLSTSQYVMDPRFEVHGCGVKIDGGETRWFEAAEFREWAEAWPWEKTALVAAHSHFDGLILSVYYKRTPGFWFDTLSMSRPLGLPGDLAEQALKLGVGKKGEELINAKGKHRKDFTDLEWARFGEYGCNDVDITWVIFQKMVDGFPEAELWLIDATTRMFTEPQLVIDEPMLKQYLLEEQAQKDSLLARVGLTKKTVGSNEKLAQVFRQLGVEPPTKISPRTKKEIYAFAKTDPGMQELLEHEDDEIRWLAEARISVKSTQTLTRGQRFLQMGAGGRPLPVYLKAYGTHTYRWSAADKTQFQNLQKTNKKDPRKGMLKKSLCAIPGRKVVAADSGAIEARVTAWLAGHEALIEGFRENRDVYSEFASEVFGRPVDRKKNPEDEVPGFISKVCVLGLGYGLGWPKLSLILLAGAMGGPPVQLTQSFVEALGVDVEKFCADDRKAAKVLKMVSRLPLEQLAVHCAVAEKLVTKYRKINKPIVTLWKTMEAVLQVMVELEEGQQVTFGPNECLTIVRHGIILPNGLTLRYPGLRKSEKTEDDDSWGSNFSYVVKRGKSMMRVHTYGGSMTENVVQALARIIVGEQVLSVRAKYGYEPVLLTHDEEAIIVPDAEAHLACQRLVAEMKIAPKWAAGLPLSAEGGYAQSYGGAKT